MNEKFLLIYDSSATPEFPQRVHDVVTKGLIQQITFEYGKPTRLPYEVGIKFMRDGFKVCEEGTTDVLKPPPVTDETIRFRIAVDEVIAKLDELSDEALRLRVAIRPGGEALLSADRDELIVFLLGESKAKATAAGELEIEFDEDALEEVSTKKEPELVSVIATIPAGGTIADAVAVPGKEEELDGIKEQFGPFQPEVSEQDAPDAKPDGEPETEAEELEYKE